LSKQTAAAEPLRRKSEQATRELAKQQDQVASQAAPLRQLQQQPPGDWVGAPASCKGRGKDTRPLVPPRPPGDQPMFRRKERSANWIAKQRARSFGRGAGRD